MEHGIKGFVIPTKSFVKIGTTKIFCYNKIFSSINKTFGCSAKFLVAATKKSFVFPNFVAVTKPFFSRASMLPSRSGFRRTFLAITLRIEKDRKGVATDRLRNSVHSLLGYSYFTLVNRNLTRHV